ncbi:hypothetical protein BO86DRAFT_384652 [Aspergillus japonicus CBS 114.51]|uniref:Uncharacterized protein n=2 Tax=Aspergillus TaxID=5052 RepID=A0A2V5HSU4_ASPV1|nr:hypothetical protein BO86DRAFT_384652 [Aspergillus japonicus CBS 114.51]PYI19370.1 hypothetical protein BO99DRAFT_402762 [Aspergillus violaceofuscus CBS 115571]RAH87563.1 hypothetical protein BO86DRAFT_384652 [Aspergillus japonicus CBS 114.51]
MSGYPTLQPAFTIQVVIDAPLGVGSASRQNSLQVVPMTGGTIKSEPGFSPALDAEFVGVGNDYIHADADGKHLRLNAHAVAKPKDDADLIYLNYTGVVTLAPEVQAVFAGTAGDGSTPFGNAFTHFTFETGSARYKDLETRVFVAQGRFNIEKGKPTVVEYRVSQVLQG